MKEQNLACLGVKEGYLRLFILLGSESIQIEENQHGLRQWLLLVIYMLIKV